MMSLMTEQEPYVGVEAAIGDLPDPDSDHDVDNHVSINHAESTVEKLRETEHGQAKHPAYARAYPDEPAFTLVAGKSAPPVHHEEPRRLTVRECARLQTFPDTFVFKGNKREQYALNGNAVPADLVASVVEGLL
ncbi:DNA cytosine methyltransferase [Halorubrum sp. SS7]|nr:DNA cytosine methyltransferase [Halorubrum sp. SS7]